MPKQIDLSECPNCGCIWSPGTWEWEMQHCAACGADNDFDENDEEYEYPDASDDFFE